MNQFLNHIKFSLIGLFLFSGILLNAQYMLDISGQVSFDDGSPAIEAGLLLIFEDNEMDEFASTDNDGNYNFSIPIDPDFNDNCFSVFLIDCDGTFLPYTDCFSEDNSDFEKDFLFCENGTIFCSTFINANPIEDTEMILLNTLNIGVGPYEYSWSNGSQESTQTVATDFMGEICVTVTDALGCISNNCITIEPEDPCFVFITEQYTYETVLLEAIGFGQSEEIDYQWSNSASGSQIQVTESGEYCVTITDLLGCSAFDCISVEVDTSSYLDCYAEIHEIYELNGNVDSLYALGLGESPFLYKWYFESVLISEEKSISTEANGEYCVSVSDNNQCEFYTCYDYTYAVDCSVYIDTTQLEVNNQLWAVGDGAMPIIYTWSTGEVSSSIIVEESNEYCVTMVDWSGCESSVCYTVNLDEQTDCSGYISTEIIDDTTSILTVHVSEGNSSGDINYLWNNGIATASLTVTNEGLYCVTATLEDGCAFEVCTYYIHDTQGVDNGLVITYYDVEKDKGLDAEIELYKVENGYIYLYDFVQEWSLTDSEGLYYIENVEDGTYLARAKPLNSEAYIPSYTSSSLYWDESDHFIVENGGDGLESVTSIYSESLSEAIGEGHIGGFSWAWGELDNIMLIYDSEVVRQSFTDINGEFMFESLPYGTYTVVRERPGEERSLITVTLSPYEPFVNGLSFDNTTNVEQDINSLEVRVFPNPTANMINISSDELDEYSSQITFYDVNGQLVSGINSQLYEDNTMTIDLTNLARGVYFVKLQIGLNSKMKRIIKL